MVERLSVGRAPFILYPLLALLSFPTLGLLAWGRSALVYAHDLLDIPRSGVPSDWLRHGLTLWNTHVGSGNALLQQQAIGPLAIDVPLSMLIGDFGAFVVGGWLLASVAGISMHLFLRDSLRLSPAAVIGGSIVFTFAFWQPIYGFVIPATPALLWLLERSLRPSRVRWRYPLAHVALGTFVLYNGQSQLGVLIAILELAFVLTIATRVGARRRDAFGWWAGAWALSFATYAPVLATQLIALPQSQRSLWVPSLGLTLPGAAIGAIELYSAVLLGVPVGSAFGTSGVYGTFFVGAVGLPLLALGVLRPGRDRSHWFLVALLFAIPILDLGTALLRPLQDDFGALKSFQLVRIRHLLPIALAAGVALGIDALVSSLRVGGPPLPRGRLRSLALAAAVACVLVSAAAAARGLVRRADGLPGLDPVALGWLAALAALLLGLAIVLAGAIWLLRRPRGQARVGTLVAILLVGLVLERGTYAQAERLIGGDLSTWRDASERTPAQEFLLAQPGIDLDRVLSFGEDANRMGAVGLLQADGYQTIYPVTYHRLFGRLIRPQLDLDAKWRVYFDRWGNRAITFGPHVDPELVALVGARWLYVRQPPPPTFNRFLYRDLPWIPTVPGIVARYQDAQVTVYEVPSVLPRAFVAGSIAVLADEAAVVDALGRATLEELRSQVFVAAGRDQDAIAAHLGSGPPAVAGTATITEYDPDRVTIEVTADRPGVLVLTDTWAPGWEAEVDAAAAPLLRVDEAFRGVLVGAGAHRVVLSYVPSFTILGFALALIAVLLTARLAGAIRWRDRRRAAEG